MTVMTRNVQAAPVQDQPKMQSGGKEEQSKAVSHFQQCHCGCTAGQRIIAVGLTAVAVLQILALAVSTHESTPREYENLADVNTALGARGRSK